MDSTAFPKDFVWGTATASYQIEGAVNEDGRGESIWDRFSHTPGKVVNGDTGDVAVDHYHRYPQDIALMQELGVGAYRFSVAWPRILPQGTGAVNPKGLDFYDKLVDALLAAKLEPYLTLYHWDLPQVLEDKGGWGNREIVQQFADYAGIVSKRLGDRVKNWATLNEPWVSAFLGYRDGVHAPGIKDEKLSLQAAHYLLMAHGAGVDAVRANAPSARVGIVLNLWPTESYHDTAEEKEIAERAWQRQGGWFLDPVFRGKYPEKAFADYGALAPQVQPGDMELIARPLDFWGINYYSRDMVGIEGRVPGSEYTEVGWEVQAPALERLLLRLKREYTTPPIYITENGAAFTDTVSADGQVHDARRVAYYQEHIAAVGRAIQQGVDVRGYFAWSLMDNFEWGWGYGKRFGITYVDYATQKRTIKDSGKWYAEFIKKY